MKNQFLLAAGCALAVTATNPAIAACPDEIAEFSQEIENMGETTGGPSSTSEEQGSDAPESSTSARADQDPVASEEDVESLETDEPSDPRASSADDTEAAQEGLTTAPGEEMGGSNEAGVGSTARVLARLSEARSHAAQGDEAACLEAVQDARELHEAM